MLALGPVGWTLTVGFAAAGLLGIFVGVNMLIATSARRLRVASGLFTLMGASVVLVSFSADQPKAVTQTWHGEIHNAAYLVLLFVGMASLALVALISADTDVSWRHLRTASRVLLPLLIAGAVLTGFASIAQLGRFVVIGALLAWAHAAAATLRTREHI